MDFGGLQLIQSELRYKNCEQLLDEENLLEYLCDGKVTRTSAKK